MKPKLLIFLGILLTALQLAGASHAQDVSAQAPWARATVPGQQASGAFMTLRSKVDARLVGASSPVAGVTEVHEMAIVDGVMRMRRVDGVRLPANEPVQLKPGGSHVMLMRLKQPLEVGTSIPLSLQIEKADGQRETLELKAEVKPLTQRMGQGGMGHGGHMQHGGMKH
ncbi:MAG: copper chaperone PCu(A)C [Burkholderiaceae bacterium]